MATQAKTAAKGAPAKQASKPAAPAQRPTQQAAKPAVTPARPANPTPQAGQQQTRVQSGDVDAPRQQAQSTAVAQRQTTAMATQQDVPDYIKQGQGRGSENVEMQDMVIPRIELVQALSKCLEEGGPEYIEGAKAGHFYNSVTRELYGPSLFVVPVFFKKQYLCWKDRKQGGGFGGAYDAMQEALERISQEQDDQDAWEAVETAQQIVLVVNPETHETSEAVLSCARTKMKISKQWNSLIRVNGFDRFSRVYELFSTDDQNNNGDRYKNIGIRYVDFASMPVFKKAEELYNSIASGAIQVKIDDDYIDVGAGAEDEPAPGTQAGTESSEY
jgi:hypothetical protein